MEQIPLRWRDAALAFSLDLARDSENFPKRVLALFDKHFGCRQSIFFPYSSVTSGGPARRTPGLSSYITYGILYGPMYDYKERMYRHDIFRWSNLPEQLRGRRVLFTEDVMSPEEYAASPYGTHMAAAGMDYQAVLYFYLGEKPIGSMALFRSKEDGPYDQDARDLLNYLSRLVEGHYHTYLRHTGESRFQDSFQLFYQNSKMGAVILNQDMTVVQCNPAAQQLAQVFWEQVRHTQGSFLHSSYQGEPRFRDVQTMVNEISQKLTIRGDSSQTVASPSGDFTFYHSAFLSSSPAGLIQTWHLLLITCKVREVPRDLEHPYSTLTQQERRIVYHLASGMKNEQIAEELHISIYTVRTHIANIYKKFEVNNKVDLLMHLKPMLREEG